ncbi:signal peptidase II [Lachnospiraceae bacterium JLR.KK008]
MIYIGIAAGIFLLELWIKNHVEACTAEGEEREVCKGALILRKYHNKGAFLDAGRQVRPLVAAASLVLTVCAAAVFALTLGQKGGRALKTGFALLLGGALSNTYDRLRRKYVVDYFSFGVTWKPLRKIVFNISDFCILIGTVIAVCNSDR